MLERRGGDNATERFDAFFASDLSAKQNMMRSPQHGPTCVPGQQRSSISTRSTNGPIWRVLQQNYPDVCSAEDIEALFHPVRSVDLYYDVVQKATMWPTRDHSIKTLAKFLGFKWRDTSPSGAASIEWFDQWIRTGDPAIRQRILDYNEDDCRATRVLLDGIRGLRCDERGRIIPLARPMFWRPPLRAVVLRSNPRRGNKVVNP